ncbi:MAG TPA: LacI family DNA-binding transcriptional regulator [Actinomycetota bacterium]
MSTTSTVRSPRPAAAGSVGIVDVAALAGVSPATVSNVLNHHERVASKTIAKVERAIAMLGYVPNGAARSLAAGRSRLVGLILSDLGNSLFVDIARGAERAADERGLSLLLANTDGKLESEDRYVSVFNESRVLGSLLTLNDETHFRALSSRPVHGQPLALLNFHADTSRFCSAYIDNEAGGHLATSHLLRTGRTRLAFVGGPSSLQPVNDRRSGFRRALAEVGLIAVDELAPRWINRADGWSIGRRLAHRVAAGEIDGIVAASDLLAAGIVQALAETPGASAPEHVGVIGYDNNQAAWDAPVPISTISQPGEELGRVGLGLLLDEVSTSGHRHRAVGLEPALVARRSTER